MQIFPKNPAATEFDILSLKRLVPSLLGLMKDSTRKYHRTKDECAGLHNIVSSVVQ